MTRDPGSPGSPSGGSGALRPAPPAGMRGALSWGVGGTDGTGNAYEVDGRPGTRGGGPSFDIDGRPVTRGATRPPSRMQMGFRGSADLSSSGPLPAVHLAPLDGTTPPPFTGGGSRQGTANGMRASLSAVGGGKQGSFSSQGSFNSRVNLGSRGGGGTSLGSTPKAGQPARGGPARPFAAVPEHDIDYIVDGLSDTEVNDDLQNEKSMNDLNSYLDSMDKSSNYHQSKQSKLGGRKGGPPPLGGAGRNQRPAPMATPSRGPPPPGTAGGGHKPSLGSTGKLLPPGMHS